MAELADALASGASVFTDVQVQPLSRAPSTACCPLGASQGANGHQVQYSYDTANFIFYDLFILWVGTRGSVLFDNAEKASRTGFFVWAGLSDLWGWSVVDYMGN